MRTFDWVSRHDERSRNYSIRTLVEKPALKSRMWLQGVVLDQGAEGACVGFGWTASLLAKPNQPKPQPPVLPTETFARNVYYQARFVDEWPGESYEGTSVLAGAKILQARGLIDSYYWCFGIEDVKQAVVWAGPVVLGIPWYDSMYETQPNGVVQIGGRLVGGHCITLTGYHPRAMIDGQRMEVFRWRNSWGTEYGKNGSGFIRAADLATLLADQGEACVPVNKRPPVL